MVTYITILILGLAVFGLSIGVIFNNKPLQGSCGGLGSEKTCELCTGDKSKCKTTEIA